jgi:hypothetical protein
MTEPFDPKKMKIEFAPGVLEQLEQDMSPEELQEFMNELKTRIEDGSFLAEAEPVDLEALEETDPEEFAQLMAALSSTESVPTRH